MFFLCLFSPPLLFLPFLFCSLPSFCGPCLPPLLLAAPSSLSLSLASLRFLPFSFSLVSSSCDCCVLFDPCWRLSLRMLLRCSASGVYLGGSQTVALGPPRADTWDRRRRRRCADLLKYSWCRHLINMGIWWQRTLPLAPGSCCTRFSVASFFGFVLL